jgi:hypothetical protein
MLFYTNYEKKVYTSTVPISTKRTFTSLCTKSYNYGDCKQINTYQTVIYTFKLLFSFPFVFFSLIWWLYCMSVFDFRLLITSLVSPNFSNMIKIHNVMLFIIKQVFHQIFLLTNFVLMCFEACYWHYCFNLLCIVR